MRVCENGCGEPVTEGEVFPGQLHVKCLRLFSFYLFDWVAQAVPTLCPQDEWEQESLFRSGGEGHDCSDFVTVIVDTYSGLAILVSQGARTKKARRD